MAPKFLFLCMALAVLTLLGSVAAADKAPGTGAAVNTTSSSNSTEPSAPGGVADDTVGAVDGDAASPGAGGGDAAPAPVGGPVPPGAFSPAGGPAPGPSSSVIASVPAIGVSAGVALATIVGCLFYV